MRLSHLLACSLLVTAVVNAQDEKPELKTTKDKVSYGIGLNIGRQFKSQGMQLDPKKVAAGIAAILNGEEPAISDADLKKAFTAFQEEMQAEKAKEAKANLAAAEKFLAENGKKEGVKTTKSGLQYKVLKQGSGKQPKATDTVVAHYKGTLLNGEMFDGTFDGKAPEDGDEPIPFGLNRVISGWTEGVQLMKVGGHFRFYIPPKMAYGESGRPSIPPNSLLIFDIILQDVK